MKKLLLLCSISFFMACNNNTENKVKNQNTSPAEKQIDSVENFGIVIHGGAGTILKKI